MHKRSSVPLRTNAIVTRIEAKHGYKEITMIRETMAQDTMTDVEIRTFRADIPEEALTDLRRRIVATRLPTKELVEDRSQGVQLATMRELARYWTTEYDWRKFEARLNTLPQFTTAIDRVEIHFILVRSRQA
jgi:hypothetical protein